MVTHLHSTLSFEELPGMDHVNGLCAQWILPVGTQAKTRVLRREMSSQYIPTSFPVESSGTGHVSLPTSASSAQATSLFHSQEPEGDKQSLAQSQELSHFSRFLRYCPHLYKRSLSYNLLKSFQFESTICF